VEISVKRMLRTRGAAVAGVTALGVGLTLVVGSLLVNVIQLIPLSTIVGLDDLQNFGGPFPTFGASLLTVIFPFTVGLFVSLWAVAPVVGELHVRHVIARAILATGIGATLVFVVQAVVGSASAVSWASAPIASPNLVSTELALALQVGLTTFVTLLPLGVLAGVFLWLWRSAHPAPHHIGGLIDEV
jgi:hypothetical protein